MSRKLHDSRSDFRSRNILAFCLFVVLGILSVGRPEEWYWSDDSS